jgi:hypothetical protein
MLENDSNDVDEVSLGSDPSVFPNLGKLRPADRYKAKLLNNIDIKTPLKQHLVIFCLKCLYYLLFSR